MSRLNLKSLKALRQKSPRRWKEKIRSRKLRLWEDESVWDDEIPVVNVQINSAESIKMFADIDRAAPTNHEGDHHYEINRVGESNPHYTVAYHLSKRASFSRKLLRVYNGVTTHIEYIAVQLKSGEIWCEPTVKWASSILLKNRQIFFKHLSCEKYIQVSIHDEGVEFFRHDMDRGVWQLSPKLRAKVYGQRG